AGGDRARETEPRDGRRRGPLRRRARGRGLEAPRRRPAQAFRRARLAAFRLLTSDARSTARYQILSSAASAPAASPTTLPMLATSPRRVLPGHDRAPASSRRPPGRDPGPFRRALGGAALRRAAARLPAAVRLLPHR